MQDAALSSTQALPAASGTVYSGVFDLVLLTKGTNFSASNNWRLGRFRLSIQAAANNTSSSHNYQFSVYDAAAVATTGTCPTATAGTLGAFAVLNPSAIYTLAGVASTGSLATVVDIWLPIRPRGPLEIACTATSGTGDNTAKTWTVSWVWE